MRIQASRDFRKASNGSQPRHIRKQYETQDDDELDPTEEKASLNNGSHAEEEDYPDGSQSDSSTEGSNFDED